MSNNSDRNSPYRSKVRAGSSSLQGRRRDLNEDVFFVSPNQDLFIIADGMGGCDAGETASRLAVEALSHRLEHVSDCAHSDADIVAAVRNALQAAHHQVRSLDSSAAPNRRPGTTVVLAFLVQSRLFVAGAGDSRAYLIRGRTIQQLTLDDSLPLMLVKKGVLSSTEARIHPWRNLLFGALGMDDFQPSKEICVIGVRAGDRLLLASDGLTDVVDEDSLRRIVLASDDPQQAAEALVQEAIARGATDDVTCLVCCTLQDKGVGQYLHRLLQHIRHSWQSWITRRPG